MNNIFKEFNIGKTILRENDKAYNKNKREQVENPHSVMGFIEKDNDIYAILEPPRTNDRILEPCSSIEKYIDFNDIEESNTSCTDETVLKIKENNRLSINIEILTNSNINISIEGE